MSRSRVLSRALTALAVAAAALVGATAAPATADPGSCTPSTGVVVVIDFRPFGGGIERGCDPTPTTGFEAMHTAGFPTVGTQHDGPGFVCRIKGLPTAAAEPCVVTPPASRYWSYWHADAGQSGWSYSQLGAASYRPKAGSVDAWVYGATDSGGTTGGPSFSPSSVRATAPAPSPTSSAGSGGGSGAGSGGSGGSGGGSGGGAAGSSTPPPSGSAAPKGAKAPGTTAAPAPGVSSAQAPGAGSSAPAASPTDSASSAPPETSTSSTPSSPSGSATDATTSASTEPPITDVRAAPTAAETATGSVWPTVGVMGLVLALAASAGVVAWRRRRTEG